MLVGAIYLMVLMAWWLRVLSLCSLMGLNPGSQDL